ncbi:NAD-dependent epimerase/dehydratase family protein, partial [Eubacteriales bacterium OttesenSCG-928-N13]|nr:NAD-dependent epimerase/dehydratase family protein [Eubacteriales bacterium OttesenSCG-928-N13]
DFAEDSLGYIDCANPRSCYPESKRAAETLCVSYAKQYAVDALIARPCHVYGPTITDENSRADAQFLRNALDGQNIVMKSAGSQVRSYLYVSDAAAAMLHLLVHGESAAAYNLANPDSVMSIREYAQLLADCAGVELRTELPSDVELAGFSKVTRATFDVKKLMNTGFVPQYAPELGVRQMIEILRNVTPVK